MLGRIIVRAKKTVWYCIGVALRFPGMSRWRQDKKPDEINTLDDLKELLHTYNQQPAHDIEDTCDLNIISP